MDKAPPVRRFKVQVKEELDVAGGRFIGDRRVQVAVGKCSRDALAYNAGTW